MPKDNKEAPGRVTQESLLGWVWVVSEMGVLYELCGVGEDIAMIWKTDSSSFLDRKS